MTPRATETGTIHAFDDVCHFAPYRPGRDIAPRTIGCHAGNGNRLMSFAKLTVVAIAVRSGTQPRGTN